jgi:hypothetical protein
LKPPGGQGTQKAAPSGSGSPGQKKGCPAPKVLEGMEPRESVPAGAGGIRHRRSNTPEQSRDPREATAGCLSAAGRSPAEENPEAEGNQRQEGIAEPDESDTRRGETLRGQVTVREDERQG